MENRNTSLLECDLCGKKIYEGYGFSLEDAFLRKKNDNDDEKFYISLIPVIACESCSR